MYAIVKSGGKQYRVEEGQSLLVERLPEEAGAKAKLEPLLYVDGSNVVDGEDLAKVSVEVRVVGRERGPKLRVVKFKPKRGYRRRTGHRQDLTRIEVTSIKLASRRPAAKQTVKPVAAEGEAGEAAAAEAFGATAAEAAPATVAEAAPATAAEAAPATAAEAAPATAAEAAPAEGPAPTAEKRTAARRRPARKGTTEPTPQTDSAPDTRSTADAPTPEEEGNGT